MNSFLKASTFFALAISFSLLFSSCLEQKEKAENQAFDLVVHSLSEPDILNPMTWKIQQSKYILKNVYQHLLGFDYRSKKLIPILAKSNPIVEPLDNGLIAVNYEIKKEAVWENGSSVTARDVLFSLKAIKNIGSNTEIKRQSIQFIKGFEFGDNEKSFSMICSPHMGLEVYSGTEFAILPQYLFDAKNLLKNYSIQELDSITDIETHSQLIEFSNSFNSEKFQREKEGIAGSGAYEFTSWESNKKIVLTKKENWWGKQYESESNYFEAYPQTITYQFIADKTAISMGLRGQKIDISKALSPSDFNELKESTANEGKLRFETAAYFSYLYIAINFRVEILKDLKVRKAIAHLIDYDRIKEKVGHGYYERVIGPIHPSDPLYYNSSIKPYGYNLDKAKGLLKASNWTDDNGDLILEKSMNGNSQNLELNLLTSSQNKSFNRIAQIIQENAAKIGVKINIIAKDFSSGFSESLTNGKFDLCLLSMGNGLKVQDSRPIFHSNAANEGNNFGFYGDEESDALIDAIPQTLNEQERIKLWKKLQEKLHDDVACVFLMATKNKLVINNQFENAYPSDVMPGFWEAGFKLKP